jgi:hypothetical protein
MCGVLSLKVVGFFCSIYAWWFDFQNALCFFFGGFANAHGDLT